jgi:hypothetical protein
MIPKMHVPDAIRDGNRFPAFAKPASAGEGRSEQIMLRSGTPGQSIARAMPNMRQEPRVAERGFLFGAGLAMKRRQIMKLALLGCAAALTLAGAAVAQAEIVYTTDSAYVTTNPGYIATDPAYVATDTNVIATTPGSVVAVPAPPFGPFTPRYIVTQPTVVVAPPVAAPRERVIERERIVVTPSKRTAGRREQVIERERVVVEPQNQVVVAPRESAIVTTGSSSGCFIDRNGFERCY